MTPTHAKKFVKKWAKTISIKIESIEITMKFISKDILTRFNFPFELVMNKISHFFNSIGQLKTFPH